MRPWNAIPIDESGEGLKALPSPLIRLEPHPYAALGAPYGPSADPFRLRSGVVERLLQAQMLLVECSSDLGLGIFDAWRPIAVQAFMVEHTIQTLCFERGIDREDPAQSGAIDAVISDVGRFWATPSRDPAMPPPHSTGAAVDLTLVDASQGLLLDMGGAIDAIGAVRSRIITRRQPIRVVVQPINAVVSFGTSCSRPAFSNTPMSGGTSAMAISSGPGGPESPERSMPRPRSVPSQPDHRSC